MKVFGLLLVAVASGLTGCGSGPGTADAGGDVVLADDRATDVDDDQVDQRDADTRWTVDPIVSDAGQSGQADSPDTSVDGSKACTQATEVRRSCDDDWDCVAALHVTDCCGSAVWLGIRGSAITAYDTLEAACERSYSACTCAAHPTTADDGSIVHATGQNAVSARCQRGACKTFAIPQ